MPRVVTAGGPMRTPPVSYTHLDVYKRQVPDDALTEEDEDILNYDDIDDPDAFA